MTSEEPELLALAEKIMVECARTGLVTELVRSDQDALRLCQELYELARVAGVRIRATRIGDTVVVCRLDAGAARRSRHLAAFRHQGVQQ